MGSRGTISWRARSPDLKPCDFFLWAYIKDQVSSKLSQNSSNLKSKCREAITSMPEKTLQNVLINLKNKLLIEIRKTGSFWKFIKLVKTYESNI